MNQVFRLFVPFVFQVNVRAAMWKDDVLYSRVKCLLRCFVFCWVIAAYQCYISALIVADWPLHYIIQNFKRFFLPWNFNEATWVISPRIDTLQITRRLCPRDSLQGAGRKIIQFSSMDVYAVAEPCFKERGGREVSGTPPTSPIIFIILIDLVSNCGPWKISLNQGSYRLTSSPALKLSLFLSQCPPTLQ